MNNQETAVVLKSNLIEINNIGNNSIVSKLTKTSLVEIGGLVYSGKELESLIKRAKRLTLKGGESYCPLCECDLSENNLFVCTECKTIVHTDDLCSEHAGVGRCKECCPECREEKSFNYNIDLRLESCKEEW